MTGLPRTEDKWRAPQAAQHYARERFASRRHGARDPRAVERLLERHAPGRLELGLLDMPCGSGRLAAQLEPWARARGGRYLGLDASRAMLAEARAAHPRLAWLEGLAQALPLASASVDCVVACRLLHHLQQQEELERVCSELLRVARHLVLASFWDARSWPALRVRLGLKQGEGPQGRRARSRAVLRAAFERAGGRVLEFHARAPLLSQQCWIAVETGPRA